MKCTACGKFLSATGAAVCNVCPCMYHRGCVAISDVDAISKAWTCPECKRKQRKGDNSSTPVKGIGAPSLACETPPVVESPQSEALLALPTTRLLLDRDSELKQMRRELAEYMAELREFRKEICASITGIGQRMDGLERRLEVVEQREVIPASNEIADLQVTVARLKSELNDRDQEALLSDLDIGHLPEESGENVLHTVTVLAAKLGVTLLEQDIVFAERVGSLEPSGGSGKKAGPTAAGRPRRVVVRLARRHTRDELLQAARVRRTLTTADVGLTGPPRRVYVNERLTRTNRQLFHRVREECHKRQWRYSWTKKGRIFARQGDGKQVFHIRSDDDFQRVFSSNTV